MSEDNPPPASSPNSPLGSVPSSQTAKPVHMSDLIAARSAEAAQPASRLYAHEAPPSSNLVLGIVGGVLAAIVGGVIWAAISALADVEVGYVAVGVAFLVGVAVRGLGRGHDQIYGIVGAACSVFGIFLGKVLAVIWVVADKENMSIMAVVSQVDWGKVFQAIGDNLNAIDFLFGFFAVVLGYKYSIKKV